jgi:hypothetical protein
LKTKNLNCCSHIVQLRGYEEALSWSCVIVSCVSIVWSAVSLPFILWKSVSQKANGVQKARLKVKVLNSSDRSDNLWSVKDKLLSLAEVGWYYGKMNQASQNSAVVFVSWTCLCFLQHSLIGTTCLQIPTLESKSPRFTVHIRTKITA